MQVAKERKRKGGGRKFHARKGGGEFATWILSTWPLDLLVALLVPLLFLSFNLRHSINLDDMCKVGIE